MCINNVLDKKTYSITNNIQKLFNVRLYIDMVQKRCVLEEGGGEGSGCFGTVGGDARLPICDVLRLYGSWGTSRNISAESGGSKQL